MPTVDGPSVFPPNSDNKPAWEEVLSCRSIHTHVQMFVFVAKISGCSFFVAEASHCSAYLRKYWLSLLQSNKKSVYMEINRDDMIRKLLNLTWIHSSFFSHWITTVRIVWDWDTLCFGILRSIIMTACYFSPAHVYLFLPARKFTQWQMIILSTREKCTL